MNKLVTICLFLPTVLLLVMICKGTITASNSQQVQRNNIF